MKLIEVVVLLGAQCISPVQHTGTATEAAKVQCAVVIEKDTEAGTLRIVPAGASRAPEVVAVLERLKGDPQTIEPAAAPPATQEQAPAPATAAAIAPPPPLASAAAEPPAAASTSAAEEKPEPEPVKAVKPKKTQKPAAKAKVAPSQEAKQAEKQATKSQCRGEAKPKWYTNAEGRRKYRCVVPG